MISNHFNAFYAPYLRALTIKNIYFNQFRYNHSFFNAIYCMIFFAMMACIFWMANSEGSFISLTSYVMSIFSLYFSDKIALKNCVKQLSKKYTIKFLTISQFEQMKYYLWREELKHVPLSYSIKKALSYLEVELSKFNAERNMPAEYLLILSSISLMAFWRVFDDIHFIGKYKVIFEALIFYLSYRYVMFKFYILSNKKNELLAFKQNLLRLKSEFS